MVQSGLDVVAQRRAINGAALSILKAARDNKDHDLALRAIDRVHKQIELQAKLLGDLDERPQVHLHLSPAWIEVRTVIISALSSYPEARAAVAAALLEVQP